jgi:hypothetical protein
MDEQQITDLARGGRLADGHCRAGHIVQFWCGSMSGGGPPVG